MIPTQIKLLLQNRGKKYLWP